jgi:hypothetical protein
MGSGPPADGARPVAELHALNDGTRAGRAAHVGLSIKVKAPHPAPSFGASANPSTPTTRDACQARSC